MDAVLETIHSVQLPARTRTKPMSVICCGMPRTGTSSLAKALSILGYDGVYHGSLLPSQPGDCAAFVDIQRRKRQNDPSLYHAAFWDRILGDYQAIADMPATAYVKELHSAYPDAKFILNTREINSWKVSFKTALGVYLQGRRYYEIFDTKAFWMRRYVETNNDPMFDGDFETNAEQVYLEHYRVTKQIIPPGELLEWSVEDGWGPLCRFLGREIPDVPFPSDNATANMLPRLAARIAALKKKANRRIAALALLLGVIGLSIGKIYAT